VEEIILGYDVRETWCEDEWEPIRQGRFKKMLSIDASLWGSVFNQGNYPDLAGEERERIGLGVIELPELADMGMNKPLWSNLAFMKGYLAACGPDSGRAYWVVAVTMFGQDLERDLKARQEWPYYAETDPAAIQDSWVRVGYDVTSCYSESMISAQLGPSLERGEDDEFVKDLNEYMLFSEMHSADRFRCAQDSANEGEAPHLVYAIWRVEEILL
jgi:hypothetical protein